MCDLFKKATDEFWIRLYGKQYYLYDGEYDDTFLEPVKFCPFCGEQIVLM